MTETILIVEDEHDLAGVLKYNFKKEGFITIVAHTASEALLRLSQKSPPDLIILDLMLPDISGLDVCRQIRANDNIKNIPVLMLTAKVEEADRITGFEVGADDYVTKPFSVRELMLRAKALLKRSSGTATSKAEEKVVFGCLKIDKGAHRIWVDKKEKLLTILEFRLLTTLIERKGRVQTRDRLLSDVWDISADVTTRTVDTHVKRLREKLCAAGIYVETVRGVGYRFAENPGEINT